MKILVSILWILLLFATSPLQSASKTGKGAAIGAGVGLIAGDGIKGAAKGALVGGGAGALTADDRNEKKTKDYAKKGAVIGAGVGLVTDGVSGAVKGAALGGGTGAIVGDQKKKN
jgi:hypothetical protein